MAGRGRRRRRAGWRGWALAGLVAASLAALVVAFFPYVFAEVGIAAERLHIRLAPTPVGDFAARSGPKLGTVVEGYWLVQDLGHDTWAIGEPSDDPDNYEYLIVGRTRALLIDAGSRSRDIRPVIARLTSLPLTVIPTHLHYDHVNGLRWFAQSSAATIALIDLPDTRERERDGLFHLSRYQYVASPDGAAPPVFHVSQWVKPDAWIDLGGRRVQVLSTPGHTPTSISVWDPDARRLFTGDLIYPTSLYEFEVGGSLSAFVATADRLLAKLPPDTTLYGAHCCRNDVVAQAPYLGLDDLRDARRAVLAVQAGKAAGRGLILRRYPVNSRMTLLTLYPLANR